jgi:hypothetical protein
LSDLVDTVNYLNNNNQVAETIANNAKELATNIINYDFIHEYFVEVLNLISLKSNNILE